MSATTDLFLNYILKITTLSLIPRNVHLILGNEACDLDSTVSCLALAYFLHENQNKNNDTKTLPLLNVRKEEFKLRTENIFVLDKIGVNTSSLYYRDTLNLNELIEKHNVKVTLVDHHVLSQQQEFLKPYVVSIFDHRPIDSSEKWNDSVNVNIKLVGSCSTLITEEMFTHPNILSPSLASILYETIIFDTIALSPTAGKVKDLDIKMTRMLEDYLELKQPNHNELFNRLWAAHNDVSNLTPKQLLVKDMKVIDKVFIPGLPMLVKDFLQLPNMMDDLKEFYKERNADALIVMGLKAKDGIVIRDLGFYSSDTHKNLLNYIIGHLKSSELLQLCEEDSNISEVQYFKQDHKPSRKQLIPLVKSILKEYRDNSK